MGAGCKRGNTRGPTSLLQNSLPTCNQSRLVLFVLMTKCLVWILSFKQFIMKNGKKQNFENISNNPGNQVSLT